MNSKIGNFYFQATTFTRCGLIFKASVFGTEDCWFDPCQAFNKIFFKILPIKYFLNWFVTKIEFLLNKEKVL